VKKLSPYLFKAFFRFFPDKSPVFCQELIKNIGNSDFLDSFFENATALDEDVWLKILKAIYANAPLSVKVEAIKMMNGLTVMDKDFLFFVLSSKNRNDELKEYCLFILSRDPEARRMASAFLLEPRSAKIRKAELIENVRVIGQIKIPEARPYLQRLGRKRFFWNRSLRTEALRALESMDGKS
jgi:hypothetical protein